MLSLRRLCPRKFPTYTGSCAYSVSKQEEHKTDELQSDKTAVANVESKLRINVPKEELEWRTPWHKKEGEHFSFLRSFYTEDNNVSLLKMLHTPIDLRPSTIKKWWARVQEDNDIVYQSYIPERNRMLGNELAAAHFIVYRKGAVKFVGEDRWIKADANGSYALPRFHEPGKILEAIDCTDMNLYYEGLVNLYDLKQLQWLSLNGCSKLDDWAVDRISNMFKDTLVYLDLRNIPNFTYRGLCALYKMKQLKILILDKMYATESFELSCLMLQELNPSLDIRGE